MDYPEWAPQDLVEHHKHLLGLPDDSRKSPIAGMSKYDFEKLNAFDKTRFSYLFGLPRDENIQLLDSLLSDNRMRSVWKSIENQIKKRPIIDRKLKKPRPSEYFRFYDQCQNSIAGWKKSQQKTPKEQEEHYTNIAEAVKNLGKLLEKSEGFYGYNYLDTIDKNVIEDFLIDLNAEPLGWGKKNDGDSFDDYQIRYILFCLSNIAPSLDSILDRIHSKAKECAAVSPIVKEPNSKEAAMHYFVRTFSCHIHREYSQPLRSVVATTASVIFDCNVDERRVRGLVKM